MNQLPHSNDNPSQVHGPSDELQPEPMPGAFPISVPEFGGREGPEPTRFGDWEKNGRCIDF